MADESGSANSDSLTADLGADLPCFDSNNAYSYTCLLLCKLPAEMLYSPIKAYSLVDLIGIGLLQLVLGKKMPMVQGYSYAR